MKARPLDRCGSILPSSVTAHNRELSPYYRGVTAGETIGGEPSTAVAVLKKPRKTKVANDQNAADASEKKLSCVAAALKVLSEAIEPMNAQEMITAMTEAGYWTSPGGKTPHATLYSAILRELTKGDDSRFVKTERGRFTIRN